MLPVTLGTISGESGPSLSALLRCSPPAPNALHSSWMRRLWVLPSLAANGRPSLLRCGNAGKHACVVACLKDTVSVCKQRCVVTGPPKAWVCTVMMHITSQGQVISENREKNPPRCSPPCPWHLSPTALALTALNRWANPQSWPSLSPQSQVGQPDGAPEAICPPSAHSQVSDRGWLPPGGIHPAQTAMLSVRVD